ncbi:MAG: hypothetical protein GY752_02530 [bacterium]|nr:hypothetical protein [bacterium]MCP4799389.1 hypothetical protein [bacterium]
MKVWLFVLLAVLVGNASAGFRDADQGWVIPPDDCRERNTGYFGAVSVSSLYQMPELPMQSVLSGWSSEKWHMAFRWHKLGGDVYREDSLSVDMLFGGSLKFGIKVEHESQQFSDVPGWNTLYSFVTRYDYRESITLKSTTPISGAMLATRDYEQLLMIIRSEDVLFALGIDDTNSGEKSVRLGLDWLLHHMFRVGAIVDTSSSSTGLTTSIKIGKILTRSSHLAHPELGMTHRWQLIISR